MRELLISEITRMGQGFCVIGLEPNTKGFSSVRPVPWGGGAWIQFPYGRADKLTYDFDPMPVTSPHLEDLRAAHPLKVGAVTEMELVQSLKQAEIADSITALFGCHANQSPLGGDAVCITPTDAKRSVCGCSVCSISFSFKYYPPKIRVALTMGSGDRLDSLPVVDRDWLKFTELLKDQNRNRLEIFFNSFVVKQLMSSPIRFARIGLARPDERDLCWPMLDSLFPLPKIEWSKEFK